MKRLAKLMAGLLLIILAICVFWRIAATGWSDRLASDDPARALEWDRNNPVALLALAQRHLEEHEPEAAQETARKLLKHEPLSEQGFVVLSEAAQAQGDKPHAWQFSTIALRRAPQELGPRAWLAGEQLAKGRYSEALQNIDRILRVSPVQNSTLFPLLIELARNGKFAEALALELATGPIWRKDFIDTLLSSAEPDALDQVLSALQRHNDLDLPTVGRWIDRLAKDGAWGEAYARWISAINRNDLGRLANIYNGGFELPVSGTGFDWRMGDSTGVIINRGPAAGASGSNAVNLMFLGRRVEAIPLGHWLLLAADTYHLGFRAMAEDLRSDRGVQWVLRCQGSGEELVASESMTGSFDWKQLGVDFKVPDQGCGAQELWLRNAGADGAGKIIRGTIRFDDFVIDRIDTHSLPDAMHVPEQTGT